MVKIGFSESGSKRRVKSMCVGSPIPLHLEAEIDGCTTKERFIHSQCVDSHEHGEWFRLNPEAVSGLVSQFKNWTPGENGVEWMPTIKGSIRRILESLDEPPAMTSLQYKSIRQNLGLTQAELSRLMGVSLRTIINREQGRPITREAELAICSLVE